MTEDFNLDELADSFNKAQQESSEPPKSMVELYDRLSHLGSVWRSENKRSVNEGKDNEREEIPRPSVAKVAKVLVDNCHFTFIGEGVISDLSRLYIYHLDLGHYVSSNDIFKKLLLRYDQRLTSDKFFSELIAFIRTETKIRPPLDDYRYIPVANGVYNIETHELEEFSPRFVITSKLDTAYNQYAKKPILDGWFDFDDWLAKIANNDSEVVTLLWQIMNEAINPNRTRKKMVLMVGDGNNGKGTFQALLENLIGRSNISNLKPEQFGKEFYLGALEGKVCNIGDDISNKYLDEVSDLMSIVSGDPVQVNRKGLQPVEARFKLLCIFSGNDLPRARNKTTGWYRRLCIIPFKADFNGQAERPEIKDKFMKNKDLLEWVLYKVLTTADFDKFIEPQAVKDLLEEYKEENDYILSYVKREYVTKGWHELPVVPVYIAIRDLKNFAINEGIRDPKLRGAGKLIAEKVSFVAKGSYKIKSARVKELEFDSLDLYDYDYNKLKAPVKSIVKEA